MKLIPLWFVMIGIFIAVIISFGIMPQITSQLEFESVFDNSIKLTIQVLPLIAFLLFVSIWDSIVDKHSNN